uniref:Uncharacterized protein n=1 Tax=viral metagenome TaxID=1070528 RepID=A0A6M3JCG0_9ZZZZ
MSAHGVVATYAVWYSIGYDTHIYDTYYMEKGECYDVQEGFGERKKAVEG